jgi:hypothetical protein
MKQLSPAQKQSFEALARQYPELGEFLSAWRQEELEKLPYGTASNLDVLRGRVQTLTELQKGLFGRMENP